MNKGSDFKIFAKYTSLNVISMIGLSCYILADTYFIANGMGENGLAALNLAIPIFNLINGIGLMLGIGGGTRYAINKALNKTEEGSHVFMNMIYLELFFAVIFVSLGIFKAEDISILMGADSEILHMTKAYIRITFLFAPAFMLNNIVNAFVKNDGNPRLPMMAMLAGSLFNIIFDYIFIFPMHMGMAGAALATGTAPLAGLTVLSIHFIRKKNKFTLCRTKPDFGIWKTCLPLGVPSLITELSSGVVIVVFNMLILKLAGNVGVAAYGIIANISLVVVAIYNGMAQGMQPVVSHAYGKGMRQRMHNVFVYGMSVSLILSVITYVILFANTDFFVWLFNKNGNQELQMIADEGIRLYFMAIPFVGINIVSASYFASTEEKIPAQTVALLRGFIVIVPVIFLMSEILGITGIWLSFPISEFVTSIIAVTFLFRVIKKQSAHRTV